MNLSSNSSTCKAKSTHCFRPSHREGLNIQYKLRDAGKSFCKIGASLNIVPQVISAVVFGRRRSARVEAEIVRILGKNDWNEVVLEARSAITGKPVNELVEELNRKLQARDAAVLSGLDAARAAAGNARPNPKAVPRGKEGGMKRRRREAPSMGAYIEIAVKNGGIKCPYGFLRRFLGNCPYYFFGGSCSKCSLGERQQKWRARKNRPSMPEVLPPQATNDQPSGTKANEYLNPYALYKAGKISRKEAGQKGRLHRPHPQGRRALRDANQPLP